jgi:phosphoadenosine phosphosulfate reductase
MGSADELNKKFSKSKPEDILDYFIKECKGEIALSSSMGAEDQVLTHMIHTLDKTVRIFTLDTGRLFPETYDLIETTNKKYDIHIEIFFPDYNNVQKMVREKGINLFYESIENRKECCNIRKIEPLKRALEGQKVWICGLRKDQSVTRFYTNIVEYDENMKLIKINPLINWTEDQIWEYIHTHNIPYNTLHDKGFRSIGCQPCTRAVKPGEEIRAGRWWWEKPEQKECGIHEKKRNKDYRIPGTGFQIRKSRKY